MRSRREGEDWRKGMEGNIGKQDYNKGNMDDWGNRGSRRNRKRKF